MGALVPARPLSPGDLAVGGTAALALPTGELARARPDDAAVAALAGPGFAATLSGRLGVARRLETTAEAGPAHVALGARWAAIVPPVEDGDDGWDLALGIRGVVAVGGTDDPDDSIELGSLMGGGGSVEVRGGRTWSDFVSVWASIGGGLLGAELDASVGGAAAARSVRIAWAGGTVGLRVGLRHVFTALEIGARWTDLTSGGEGAAGLVVLPAVGLSIETR